MTINKNKFIASSKRVSFIAVGAILILFASCSKDEQNDLIKDEKPQEQIRGELTSIEVKTEPTKQIYFIGDSFSNTGLVVVGKYSSGEEKEIPVKDLTIVNFDSSKEAEKLALTLKYKDFTTTINVQVYPFIVKEGGIITKYTADYPHVVIPEGITAIEENVFFNKTMESVAFPSTLVRIGKYAFFCCRDLKNIKLPVNLEEAAEGAFDNCISLESADLSETKLVRIENYLFNRCGKLATVIFPDKVTEIGSLAFSSTLSLKNVKIPVNTRFIGLDAFRESGVEEVALNNNLIVIRQRAFLECRNLKRVFTYGDFNPYTGDLSSIMEFDSFRDVPALSHFEFPKGISHIGQTVLSGCPLLESIVIPESVKSINYYAFSNTSLKQVIVESPKPANVIFIIADIWDAFPQNTKIQVPAGAAETYKKTAGWNKYTYL